ncbi:MAG: hypothetical protein QXS24_01650 [Desulfurococcaceae archaeon]
MRKNALIISTLCLMLIAITMFQLNVVVSQQGYDALFVFYIPFGDVNTLLDAANNKLNTSIINLKLDITANPDFYLYWLITGEIPSNTNISLLDVQANQERILYLWSNATLIDIPVVNPEKHPSAINPVMNISANYIPPFTFDIPINSSKYLDSLGTDVLVEVNETNLKVTLTKYNVSLTTNFNTSRTLGPTLVNITEPETIAGEYFISFYVVSVDNYTNMVKLFFPGSIKTSYYASQTLGDARATTHWYLVQIYRDLASSLPQDALNWWINSTINTTVQFLTNAIHKSQNAIYITYIPQPIIADKILDEQSIVKLQQYLFDQLVGVLVNTVGYTKQNYLAVFILVNNEKSYAVFAGKNLSISGEVNVNYTMTQMVGTLLSYSNALPFNNSAILSLSTKIRELEGTVSQLRTNVDELNSTLTNTKNKLTSCESERELLRAKTADIDVIRKEAEELMNTAKLYIAGGLAVVIAISSLLGFLALRIATKKKSAR